MPSLLSEQLISAFDGPSTASARPPVVVVVVVVGEFVSGWGLVGGWVLVDDH